MKKLVFTVIVVLSQSWLISQSCLPEGIVFTTHTQIQNFSSDYPGCTEIEGDVEITGIGICNLFGLMGLKSIDGNLKIIKANFLDSLTGLDSLTTIGGDFWIKNNFDLLNLKGLESLETIAGSLVIAENASLDSLSGPINLNDIGKDLIFQENPVLASLKGLESLNTIHRNLYFDYNQSLKNLSGLSSLDSIYGKLELYRWNGFDDFSGLDSLCFIGGDLVISHSGIDDFTGLENLTKIGGNFKVYRSALYSFAGLTSLDTIGRSFQVGNIFGGNDYLTDLSSLENLKYIGLGFEISGNDLLNDLSGLINLNYIGGTLYIKSNPSLTNLNGFDNLLAVYGNIRITSNHSLTSLSGIRNIESAGIEDIIIYDNLALSTCEEESICNYLLSPNGIVHIYANAPGCNSQAEVDSACLLVNVEESQTLQDNFNYYPNPFTSTLKINYQLDSPETVNISVFNTTGKCIKKWRFDCNQVGIDEFTLNLNGIPSGIYFLKLRVGNSTSTRKIVKL